MGRDLENILRSAGEGAADLWHQARAKMVADADDAYQRGRQAYTDTIRTGRNVLAQTPQQVRALGGAVNAGVRSAANAATLGLADNAEAATGALFGAGGPGDFGQRYHNELVQQHSYDQQAAREHPFATTTGTVLGSLGAVLTADAPAVAGVAARAIPGGAKVLNALAGAKRVGFVAEGLPTMAAVGGGAIGGATQFANDAMRGRWTSGQDFLGAVGGGALGGVEAVRFGPVIGGAVGGGATAALQGGDLDDITRGATEAAYLGRGLGTLGEQISSSLPTAAKGALGEGLTFAKSWARGEPIPPWEMQSETLAESLPRSTGKAGPQQRIGLSKSYTRADWLTAWGRALEAKFGPYARLSTPQTRAGQELGPLYQPDHWQASDVGNFSGGWLAPAVGQQPREDGGAW